MPLHLDPDEENGVEYIGVDPFAHEDTAWRAINEEEWFHVRFMALMKRRKQLFRTKDERAKVLRVTRLIAPYKVSEPPISPSGKLVYIPFEFAREIIDWTAKQNERLVKINATVFLNMLLSEERISVWVAKHTVTDVEIRSGYDIGPNE